MFDQSFVAIRSREPVDLFDLGLHVARDYWWQILGLLFVGALPWIVLDAMVVSWIMVDVPSGELTRVEGWVWLVLVASQSQIGTVLISHFLGQATFTESPHLLTTLRSVLRSSVGLIWLHGILRGVILVLMVSIGFSLSNGQGEGFAASVFWSFVAGIGMLLRVWRPYVNEVLLLEQAPFRAAKGSSTISFGRRSKALHGSGGLLGRSLLSILFAIAMALALFGAINYVVEMAVLGLPSLWWQDTIIWVTALWLTAGFMAIVRFLAYLDLRIRQEGWDVELLIRAEAFRMMK